MEQVVYGSELSKEYRLKMKEEIDALRIEGKRIPKLAVVLVGNNPASLSYVTGKKKACANIGMESLVEVMSEDTTMDELLNKIDTFNKDQTIDGILVQLPLPKHLDETKAILAIDPSKDVDGLHPLNIGKFYSGLNCMVPCTPLGVMELLKRMDCKIEGKRAVVLGRSKLVGTPVARLLQNENATVTVCHSRTKDLKEVCKEADIVVAAIGQPKMIDHTYIKDGAYVIDVGIHRMDNGKLCGDVDFDDVYEHTTKITPVPKGVGPMTICMLLANTMKAYKEREANHD